jgi:3-deoxy-D-manno-octulosonic acid kinase
VGAAIARGPGWSILHDPALVAAPGPELFDPAHWADRVVGYAGRGRGRAMFVDAGAQQWVLRHYRRGGLMGRIVADRYPWLGEARTRPFREWQMLARLYEAGLPVPRPVAARWQRHGLAYTGDLATLRIAGAVPLSARICAGEPVAWGTIGQVLRAFHDAGACHADLNAHNILLDGSGAPWVLDFDRGQFRARGAWAARNLARLKRSLRKLAAEPGALPFSDADWAALHAGYAEGGDLRLRPRRP